MERMKCPECGFENPMTGVVHETRQFVCRQCGMVYYTPDSCLTEKGTDEPPPDRKASSRSPGSNT